jgi:carbonic anhydrase
MEAIAERYFPPAAAGGSLVPGAQGCPRMGSDTMRRSIERGLGLVLALLAVGGVPSAPGAQEFCYGPGDGSCAPPDRWPGACNLASSNRQSPVDIFDSRRARLPELVFRYRATPLKVLSNGHTVEVEYGEGRGDVRVGGETCALRQFHFHTTAEHAVGGAVAPLEAHLVHACPSGGLVVVGVLMNYAKNEPNRALEAALDGAPRTGGKFVVGEREVAGREINAQALLPADRRYFTYSGSLTTPPCSEVVRWVVLQRPMEVSRDQVLRLQRLLAETSPDGFARNNRPLQDLERRTIRASLPPR